MSRRGRLQSSPSPTQWEPLRPHPRPHPYGLATAVYVEEDVELVRDDETYSTASSSPKTPTSTLSSRNPHHSFAPTVSYFDSFIDSYTVTDESESFTHQSKDIWPRSVRKMLSFPRLPRVQAEEKEDEDRLDDRLEPPAMEPDNFLRGFTPMPMLSEPPVHRKKGRRAWKAVKVKLVDAFTIFKGNRVDKPSYYDP
ncbi:hypothetical protein CYLTODRAFT_492138 [Cylindrobasidium torrendii FP15055 ss-10]|uniref:Uncharacterized protein n=1 Tax=Cylindrobasidium torrendii FP15055 ss-10 TaxID=1314674 RepID=A0A0D7B5Z9_9AGAR|nr:hypothetical protein CYLTODRAFT_492138 [Cylindrobasidium torrendii FP15055 ss-10]